MISVLTKIASVKYTNYTFFADGGGMTLRGVTRANESGCIELDFDSAYLIKLARLDFVAVGNLSHSNNSYFRLITINLEPSGVYETYKLRPFHEHLVELSPLKYIDGKYWDYGEYQGNDLPSAARPLTRILRGDLVIFSKSSVYNQITNTDDGRHATMGAETFKKYVSELYKMYMDQSSSVSSFEFSL